MANGQPWQSNGAKQVLEPLAEHPLWKNREQWEAAAGKNGTRRAARAWPSAAGSAACSPPAPRSA